MLVPRRFRLGRLKMLGFLDELGTVGGKAGSVHIPPGASPTDIEGLLGKVVDITTIPPDLAGLIAGSKTGAVLFWGLRRRCLVLPPFPITEERLVDGYDVEPLRLLLKRDFMVALILVRLGAYSVGVCKGTVLIRSKAGTGLVHARHKKGGSSQGRFQRHREKQIEHFLDRVCGQVREQLEPHAPALDYVVYGGARTTIQSLRKRCPFLHQFDSRILRLLLDIPEPRRAVLATVIDDIWSSHLTEWHDEEVLGR